MPKQALFVLTDELRQVLDNVPAVEPRSCLDPLRPFILRWRRAGRTYRNIQQILANECDLRVHHETLRRYIKRYSRPRKPVAELELEEPPMLSPTEPARVPVQALKKLTPEEAARQRAILQGLRNKPAVAPEPAKKFVYDPDEPLIIDRTIKD